MPQHNLYQQSTLELPSTSSSAHPRMASALCLSQSFTNLGMERDASRQELIQSVFENAAKDKDGMLDHRELASAMVDLDMDTTLKTPLALLKEWDADGNGLLDYQEFSALMKGKLAKDVYNLFSTFANGRGYLTEANLSKALKAVGVDLNSEETKARFQKFGVNKDGQLGPLGFADLVSHSPKAKLWLLVDSSGRIRNKKGKSTRSSAMLQRRWFPNIPCLRRPGSECLSSRHRCFGLQDSTSLEPFN